MRNGSFSWRILASAIRHGGSSGPDVAGMGLILEVNGLLRCDTTEALNSFTVVVKVWVFVSSSFFDHWAPIGMNLATLPATCEDS